MIECNCTSLNNSYRKMIEEVNSLRKQNGELVKQLEIQMEANNNLLDHIKKNEIRKEKRTNPRLGKEKKQLC